MAELKINSDSKTSRKFYIFYRIKGDIKLHFTHHWQYNSKDKNCMKVF